MEYISSDTNVWIDFFSISALKVPFKLDYEYVMYYEAVEAEIAYPAGLKEELKQLGLHSVDITTEEFVYANEITALYPKLSAFDRIALAIAAKREIILLTGDASLRKAALKEGVDVIGTIGLLDKLLYEEKIDRHEYLKYLQKLSDINGGVVRLPHSELQERLDKYKTSK